MSLRMNCQDVGSKFGAADYAVFVTMLLVSSGVGIFWAVVDKYKGKGNVEEYLVAGRLFAGAFWTAPITLNIFIPFFYKLKVTSQYEYLGMRFGRTVRLMATAAHIIQFILYIGIMIFAPALALSAVTGFNLWAAIFTIGIVCTFYTTIGGLKAVIWTDVLQGVVVWITIIVVMFMGASKSGGFGSMWELGVNSSRIEFPSFETDPRYRTTFWSMVFGLGTTTLSMNVVSQAQTQRYLCCKSLTDAKKGWWLQFLLGLPLHAIVTCHGLIAYAYYRDCDPVSWYQLSKGECGVEVPDQLIPYMVMEMFGGYPGLPGLFVAGVFASSLSTVSSGINALVCVVLKDFVEPFVNWKERTHVFVSKVLAFTIGFLCIAFACLATTLGFLLQISLSIQGLIGGPLLAVFSLGMLLPYPNAIGTGCGLVIGLSVGFWAFIGSTTIALDHKFIQIKPISTDNCIIPNATAGQTFPQTTPLYSTLFAEKTTSLTTEDSSVLDNFYSLSYAYYAAVGCLATLVTGLVISIITRYFNIDNEEVPQRLVLTKFDRKTWSFLPESVRRCLWCDWEAGGYDKENTPSTDNKIYPETVDYRVAVKAISPHSNPDGSPIKDKLDDTINGKDKAYNYNAYKG